jgi:hypothetical protein
MYRSILLCLLIFTTVNTFAQSSSGGNQGVIDIRRIKLHEDIDTVQNKLASLSFYSATTLSRPEDDSITIRVKQMFLERIDSLQAAIEKNSDYDHRIKVKYLTGLNKLLWQLPAAFRDGKLNYKMLPEVLEAYIRYLDLDFTRGSLQSVVQLFHYEINEMIFNNQTVFFDNSDLEIVRMRIYLQYINLNPVQILPTIQPYLNQSFADSLLITAAEKFPAMFYNYASATGTEVGKRIQQINHPLVNTVAKVAREPKARLIYPYLPFLLNGELTIDSVKNDLSDNNQYYNLLINTLQKYIHQKSPAYSESIREINLVIRKKSEEFYINEINALHDEQPEVRFRILEPLTPIQLYYIIVNGEDILYASSYTGVYSRLMSLLDKSSGDSLFQLVQYDRFRKFIRMAAGYNRLDHFLSSMPALNAHMLMRSFVQGLEQGLSLENAVDVADSYASIENKEFTWQISREIIRQQAMHKVAGNNRGFAVYDILQSIFRSAYDSAKALTLNYSISPVYGLSNIQLSDTAGQVIEQLFFYGDKDGIESFNNFLALFSGKKEWQIIKREDWVEIIARTGKSIRIYANVPHDNSSGEDLDARAQSRLNRHLADSNLQPRIVVHRGHSYHLKYTLEQLPESAKIVILGSCGSYQNLDAVLEVCPDAHILSSKEVGTRLVNEPVLRIINESLRNGQGVNWIKVWKQLAGEMKEGYAKERLENYIPPHQNMGALFIKAFRNWERLQNTSE